MVKKMELINNLLTIYVLIASVFSSYLGITLSRSPNFFKEIQGAWLIFIAVSGVDFLAFSVIDKKMNGTLRHNTVRSSKEGTIVKHTANSKARMLTPLAIALIALTSIFFSALFIDLAAMLVPIKNPYIYMMFLSTTFLYIAVTFYGIEVWRYKKTLKTSA